MKKLISIILTLAMVLALATVVFAAEGEYGIDKGTITINKYNSNNTYSLYMMLKLESFNTDGGGKYAYIVNDGWEAFFAPTGDGYEYVTITDGKYITWNTAKAESEAAEFAQKALSYAQSASGVSVLEDSKDSKNENITVTIDNTAKTCVFENLDLGYYLVDSTMGALCGLTTTNLNASINAKNGEPTILKQVLENSNDQWGPTNTANIGDTIRYKITVTTQPGAQNYVVHDHMVDALRFDPESVAVTYDGATVAAGKYTLVTTGLTDTCTFEVRFTEDFCKTLGANKPLIISYTALLTDNATVAGEGNTNTTHLSFGDDHECEPSTVVTKTYAFDLVKTDGQNELLVGAFFEMYRTAADGEPVQLVKVVETDGTFYYRPYIADATGTAGDTGTSVTEFEVEGGIIHFEGFDPGDYYFHETQAPEGYNKLSSRALFTLGEYNKDAIFNGPVYSSGSGFHITNLTGSMLPETGGIGTLLFTLLGGSTALGTGVVLVTKKRMSKIRDEE